MKTKAPKRKDGRPTVHLIGNAHLDPVWLWRWQEGFAEAKATFRSALDRMTETPGYVFTCAAAAIYEWVEENDPAMFREIRRRVRQGRWAITGGWWIQPDCNIPCGEALVRQGLCGQRYFRQKFGVTCRAGYCVDSFGHAGTLPKILRGCGMRGYVFMRPQAHENAEIPPLAFRWMADDGSAVTALHVPDAYATWTVEALARKIPRNVELAARTPLKGEVFVMYGVGNHGGGPTKAMLQAITHWRKRPGMPRLVYSSPERFLEVAESRRLPVWKRELQHHARGCYAAHSGIKALNRRAEQGLLAAEMWGSAARMAVGKAPVPRSLARAWKHVLFNQFHDILAGSSIEAACRDASDQLGAALHEAAVAHNSAQQAVSWQIDTRGEGTPLVVFNNQPFAFEGVVDLGDVGFCETGHDGSGPLRTLTDNDGRPIPHQRIEPDSICGRLRFAARVSLPALGYVVLRKGTDVARDPTRRLLGSSAIRAKNLRMENDKLRVGLDRRGYLVLYDKVRRRRVFGNAGGIPLVIEDTGDTWGHGVDAYRKVLGRFRRVEARLVETGPLRGCISVRYRWGDSLLQLDYLLGAGERLLTVRGRVDWREQWKLLKLAFPMPFRCGTWTAEVPYGTAVRPTDGGEEPVQQWVDFAAEGRGLAIANDSKYSCSAEADEVRVTILRSPPYAYHLPFRPGDIGQHVFLDQGPQAFRLALIPHDGDWRGAGVIEAARQLNRPPNTVTETFHKGKLPARAGFVKCSGKGVYVEAIKEREDGGGLIVRAAEWHGKRRAARFALPAIGRTWTADFRRGEIKTFLIPPDRRGKVREVSMLEE